MKSGKKKDLGELRFNADEFDKIMQRALGVAPNPALKTVKSSTKRKTSSSKRK